MKKYILLAFAVFLMFVTTSSALGISRDALDHVQIVAAVKSEVCRIENPGCGDPQPEELIENPVYDVRINQSATCLRQKLDELECQGGTAEMILGQFKIYAKTGKEGGAFYSNDISLIINGTVYGPGMTFADYYSNRSKGGWIVRDDPNHPEKFRGLRYLASDQPRRFDPDIPPFGHERVKPGFLLIYYDEDGTMHVYLHLKDEYYKMTAIKKRVENKTWVPPPEPEKPDARPKKQPEAEVPKKIEVPTPIPPPPVYLPGMPETADPKKEHVIPNCNSQGASVCRYNEECPDDKWMVAKEERCCSVICTPVGKKETPPGLEKKNETEMNKTRKEKPQKEANLTVENETETETEAPEIDENITVENETGPGGNETGGLLENITN